MFNKIGSLKPDFIAFFLLAFVLSRQFPLNLYSGMLNVFTLIFIISTLPNIKKINLKFLIITVLPIPFLVVYSIVLGNDISLIIRFMSILLILNLPLIFGFEEEYYFKIFKFTYFIHASVIIFIAVYMGAMFDSSNYSEIRRLFLNNGWGDVYTYNGYFFRVQLLGNALIPLLLFITYDQFREKIVSLYHFLFSLLALIFAGNLAFLLSFAFYVIVYELLKGKLSLSIKKAFAYAAFFLSFPIFVFYIIRRIEMKLGGASSSLGIRADQISVLINDMSDSVCTLLFGMGIGNTVDVITHSRDYIGDIYFELQSVYFLNQLGFVIFIALLIVHLYMFFSLAKTRLTVLMYFSYLSYAFTNPYMLDTTHFVAIIVILSYQMYKYKVRLV
ncbi:MAG: hypothetical protein ACK5MK_12155 [Dysgonomonas sp.]